MTLNIRTKSYLYSKFFDAPDCCYSILLMLRCPLLCMLLCKRPHNLRAWLLSWRLKFAFCFFAHSDETFNDVPSEMRVQNVSPDSSCSYRWAWVTLRVGEEISEWKKEKKLVYLAESRKIRFLEILNIGRQTADVYSKKSCSALLSRTSAKLYSSRFQLLSFSINLMSVWDRSKNCRQLL